MTTLYSTAVAALVEFSYRRNHHLTANGCGRSLRSISSIKRQSRVFSDTRAGDDGFQGSVAQLDVRFPKYSQHQMEPASSAGG